MNFKFMSKMSIIVFIGFTTLTYSYAQTTKDSHGNHHPEAEVINKSSGEMKMEPKEMNGMEMAGKDGMMNKAEMKKMNVMMKNCMNVHKDKKMCNQNMMENCQMKNGKGECLEMMKNAKDMKK